MQEWRLVSGATNKLARLGLFVQELGLDVHLLQQPSLVDVPEANYLKGNHHLYDQKAADTWLVMARLIASGIVGLTNDVHPKLWNPRTGSFPNPLVKPDQGSTPTELAEFIESNFGPHGDERLLIRLGAGVVPWTPGGLIAMIMERLYIKYSQNPLPDKLAARDYLQWASETHPENGKLERSGKAAGAILHRQLVEWAVSERKIGVQVDHRHQGMALEELDALGDGFSKEMVLAMYGLVGMALRSKHDKRKGMMFRSPTSFWPSTSSKIIWSAGDARFVEEEIPLSKFR